MANIRTIAQLGDPVLRQKARKIENTNSPALRKLVDDLFITVHAVNGAGIAAPQVSESERLIIVCSRPTPRYPYAPDMKPTVMFNPQIEWMSDEIEKDWEGCLSIPGIRAKVSRSSSIRANYQSREGKTVRLDLDGFIARIFQHEVDHLEGIVYLDRVENSADIFTEQEFLKQISESGPLSGPDSS
jgi:peptide deformylase